MKSRKFLNIKTFLLISTLMFVGCSPYKHISKDGYLLSKNKVILDSKALNKSDFVNLIKQDPNTSFLGVKWGMYIYSLSPAGEDSTVSFISRNVFRKLGQKPVEYDSDLTFRSTQEMENFLKHKGCFDGKVSDSTKFKKRKAKEYYYIHIGERYKIDTFFVSSEDKDILSSANTIMINTPIKKGMFYDEEVFAEERKRLALELRNHGYYDFGQEYIQFNIDTNNNNYTAKINLDIKTKTPIKTKQDEDSITKIVPPHIINSDNYFKKFKLRNIYIYPDYTAQLNSLTPIIIDTTILFHRQKEKHGLNRYIVISPNPKRMKIKPILRSIMFQRDSLFSTEYLNRTYNALNQLKNFKFIEITYSPITTDLNQNVLDTALLDCMIKLSLAKPILFSTSLEANFSAVTNSLLADNSSNLGMEWNMNIQHKNIFKSAEIFFASLKAAVEIRSDIFGKGDSINKWSLVNALETGIDVGLELPRFLVPFGTRFYSMQFLPHTRIKAGYNFQKRAYFERSILNFNYGYSWNYTTKYNHLIIPLEVNLVKMKITNDAYTEYINNLDRRIRYQYSDHLVINARYSYIYNQQDIKKKSDFNYFRFNIESAGNLPYLINNLAKSPKNELNEYTIFDIPYSQYLRSDADFKRYIYLDEKEIVVLRVFGGVGIPYGNAKGLPYEKSFFSGGANNHRAWQLRELGPGGSKIEGSEVRFDRSGDIAFGANFEYRFPIAGAFEGASFIDVGNIWTLYDQKGLENGQFNFNSFYKELATGAGLGIRLNIQFIIIRLDFAIKLWNPSKDLADRWVLPNTKFSDINVQFGIGYPF